MSGEFSGAKVSEFHRSKEQLYSPVTQNLTFITIIYNNYYYILLFFPITLFVVLFFFPSIVIDYLHKVCIASCLAKAIHCLTITENKNKKHADPCLQNYTTQTKTHI